MGTTPPDLGDRRALPAPVAHGGNGSPAVSGGGRSSGLRRRQRGGSSGLDGLDGTVEDADDGDELLGATVLEPGVRPPHELQLLLGTERLEPSAEVVELEDGSERPCAVDRLAGFGKRPKDAARVALAHRTGGFEEAVVGEHATLVGSEALQGGHRVDDHRDHAFDGTDLPPDPIGAMVPSGGGTKATKVAVVSGHLKSTFPGGKSHKHPGARALVGAAARTHPPTTLASMVPSQASEAMQFDFGAPDGDDRPGDGTDAGTACTGIARPEAGDALEDDGTRSWAEPGATAEGALTVGEFYDRLRAALSVEFPREIWVTGEIRKVTVNRGNRYLELADTGASGRGGTAPMLDVACWWRDWPVIGAELQSVGLELVPGLVVRIRGRVGVWDGAAKLRFSMTDLDVAAMLGGIAAARRKLLVALQSEDLLEANRRLRAPLVPLRVALVTSAGSEAYRDFTGQLERSGYGFRVRLEACSVQGPDAAPQVAAAIRRAQDSRPDVIVLVRGGGGRGDLAAFDHELVARAIASSRCPVWTGIGHTGDRSVADEVAQRALVTPTGCGEAVVAAVAAYLERVDAAAVTIAGKARAGLERAGDGVVERRRRLAGAARHELGRAESALVLASSRAVHGAVVGLERNRGVLTRQSGELARISSHALAGEADRVARLRTVLGAYDPRRQLARGWSLTRSAEGRVIRSVEDVETGDEIVTMLADGTVSSRVLHRSRVEESP